MRKHRESYDARYSKSYTKTIGVCSINDIINHPTMPFHTKLNYIRHHYTYYNGFYDMFHDENKKQNNNKKILNEIIAGVIKKIYEPSILEEVNKSMIEWRKEHPIQEEIEDIDYSLLEKQLPKEEAKEDIIEKFHKEFPHLYKILYQSAIKTLANAHYKSNLQLPSKKLWKHWLEYYQEYFGPVFSEEKPLITSAQYNKIKRFSEVIAKQKLQELNKQQRQEADKMLLLKGFEEMKKKEKSEKVNLSRIYIKKLISYLSLTEEKKNCFQADLFNKYNHHKLAYHNHLHLHKMFYELDDYIRNNKEYRNVISNMYELKIAILMHDFIKGCDNEVDESIKKMKEYFKDTEYNVEHIADLIKATDYANLPESLTEEQKLIQDLDLSILGSEEKEYQDYSRRIRKEYKDIPDEEFNKKRSQILNDFLEKENIYNIEYFQMKYETEARANIDNELDTLK